MTRTAEQILCCPEGCKHTPCLTHDATIHFGPGADMLIDWKKMPPADRLTLARAIAPDGWVVAKLPEEKDISGGGHGNGYNLRAKMGWNSCRAAMLASSEETP